MSPDVAASVRARLLDRARMKDFHDVWALPAAFAFGALLQRAVAACLARRGTPLTAEIPRALAPAFYQLPELEARWRSYRSAGTIQAPPPAQFEVIGERIVQFLGPVRDSIVAGEPFDSAWPPAGPWEARS